MSGPRILALAQRIVRQFRRDHRSLALLFVAPLVIFSLLWYLFRGAAPERVVGVVDDDQGPAAHGLVAALREAPGIRVNPLPDSTAGDRQLRDGTVAGYLVIPAGLSAPGSGSGLTLVVEGTNPSESGVVAEAVSGALQQGLRRLSPVPLPRLEIRALYGQGSLDSLDYLAPVLIGFFAFFLVYLLTSVSFLRERTQGTLERLMASPLRRADIALGYMLGFLGFALVQSLIILLFSIYVLKVHFQGNLGLAFLFMALLTVGAVNLGIFLSTFARTELQVVQFMPLVLAPQALLSGMFFAVESMPQPLQVVAHVLPLTYAQWGLRDVMIRGFNLEHGPTAFDLAILVGFAALMIVLAALTLRRQVA